MHKLITLVITLALLSLQAPSLIAQKGSADKQKSSRNIKKEMKEVYYDIEKYEQMKNQMQDAQVKSDSIKNKLEEAQSEASEMEEEIEVLKREQEENQRLIQDLEAQNKETLERSIPLTGIFFSIQIGAYNRRDISHLIKVNEAELSVEESDKGLKKYLIGGYEAYEEAAKARLNLRKLGFKDAWIVAYKDGVRVDIGQVRDTPIPKEELQELERIK